MIRFFRRLLSLFQSRHADTELAREMATHLALLEDEHRRRGLTQEDARLAARRAMGNSTLVRDLHRDARTFGWLEDVTRDVRHTFRSLGRSPGFTAVAVLTLALGIGANTAIFSVVNTVLLRPLPYEYADRLVRVVMTVPAQTSGSTPRRDAVRLSAAELEQLRQNARTLANVGVADPTLMNLRGRDPRLQGATVSAEFFAMLRAQPVIGRVLTVADEAPGAEPVILLSYETWRRYFAADPAIVGRTVTFDPVLGPPVPAEYTVVGVMPPTFQFPNSKTSVWRPPQLRAPSLRGVPRASLLARLADGVSHEAASAEILPLIRKMRVGQRDASSSSSSLSVSNDGTQYEVVIEQDEIVRPVRPALVVLTVAVGLVLLLACVNVANLLLARTSTRQRELVIRAALGAGRGHLIRFLMTECLTLALCGGLAGMLLAFAGVRLLRSLTTTLARLDLGIQLSFPRIDELGVDWTVLTFSLVVSLAVGVLFGLPPAFRYARSDRPVDREASIAAGLRRSANASVRGFLVAAEIALAIALLAGGGLLIRSFVKLSSVEAGYDPTNVVTFQVAVPADLYPPARVKAFADELVARLQTVPGVDVVAYANQLPMVSLVNSFPLRATPDTSDPARPPPPPPGSPDIRLVSRDYLKAMGIPVLAGRGFLESDGPGRPRVMLINEALARRDFAGRNPVGETVFIGRFPDPWQIVGVVGNVRQFSLELDPQPQFFVDLRQWSNDALVFPAGAYYAARTRRDPPALVPTIRNIVQQLDPQAVLFYVAPMEQVVASTISRPRMYAVLLGIFASVGTGLSAIGICGVVAYTVSQRTREIGIRMALGAQRSQVVSLVVGQCAMLTMSGILAGLAGAALLSRYLEGMLFGITPLDPSSFAAAVGLLTLLAVIAAYGPVRRATRINPIVALRAE